MTRSKGQARSSKSPKPQRLLRSFVLGGILALWMGGLVARLYSLQVIQYVEWLGRAQRQQQHTVEVSPQRGVIYDCQMQPLAMSLTVDSIYAVPSEIPNPQMVAGLLAPILGVDAGELSGEFQTSRSFCWIKRKVSNEESARVHALNLKGICFQKEAKRFYPKGELAAHVMGSVGLDDNGMAGIEHQLDGRIKGRPGRVLVAWDARRQSFRSSEWQGQPGKNVVLTLDENVQYIVERALAKAVQKWHAAGGTVIVQNPNTGEILAMASEPTFNPNDYGRSSPDALVNRAVGWVYEPGSTFKIIPLSAALEENLTRPDEVINCQMGSIVLAGHVIHDHKPFGDLTVEQVLAHSSDVGAIKLGLRLGQERLDRYIRAFGFDARTEIGLPGEERGLLKPPDRWSGISIGEISMGQEVGVTPLQLVTAYSAVVNGGMLIQPRIVRDVFLGNIHDPSPPVPGRRVVSQQTANTMKQMFQQVVEAGTGTTAHLSGYTSAGKTGTAQKIDASGRYSKSQYISSFVGFAPVTKPAITVLVVVDSPVGAIYGAEVAAPVFRTIAEQTLGYLNVPLDNPSKWLQVVSPSLAESPRHNRGEEAGFLPPEPESSVSATSTLQLASFPNPAADSAPRPIPAVPPRSDSKGTVVVDGPLLTVPVFTGQTARQVAAQAQKLGLELDVNGTGLAAEQQPPAGARVPAGTHLWVRFSR